MDNCRRLCLLPIPLERPLLESTSFRQTQGKPRTEYNSFVCRMYSLRKKFWIPFLALSFRSSIRLQQTTCISGIPRRLRLYVFTWTLVHCRESRLAFVKIKRHDIYIVVEGASDVNNPRRLVGEHCEMLNYLFQVPWLNLKLKLNLTPNNSWYSCKRQSWQISIQLSRQLVFEAKDRRRSYPLIPMFRYSKFYVDGIIWKSVSTGLVDF